MSKNNMLKIINPVLALLILNQATTGILHNVLPHGVFELMHKGGWVLVIVTIVHVCLNWGWVKLNLLNKGKTRETL